MQARDTDSSDGRVKGNCCCCSEGEECCSLVEGELTEGTTDNLQDQMEFIKTPSSSTKATRKGNPNAGYLRGMASFVSMGLTFAKETLAAVNLAQLTPEIDLYLKASGFAMACLNMAASCKRNLPSATDSKGHEFPNDHKFARVQDGMTPNDKHVYIRAREAKEKNCHQAISTKRVILKLVAAGGGAAIGFYVGGPLGAVSGAQTATKVLSMMTTVSTVSAAANAAEVVVNMGQQRPYADLSCFKRSDANAAVKVDGEKLLAGPRLRAQSSTADLV